MLAQHVQHLELDPHQVHLLCFGCSPCFLLWTIFPRHTTHFSEELKHTFSLSPLRVWHKPACYSTLKILRHLNGRYVSLALPIVILWADGCCEQWDLLVDRDLVVEWYGRELGSLMEEKCRRHGDSVWWQFEDHQPPSQWIRTGTGFLVCWCPRGSRLVGWVPARLPPCTLLGNMVWLRGLKEREKTNASTL